MNRPGIEQLQKRSGIKSRLRCGKTEKTKVLPRFRVGSGLVWGALELSLVLFLGYPEQGEMSIWLFPQWGALSLAFLPRGNFEAVDLALQVRHVNQSYSFAGFCCNRCPDTNHPEPPNVRNTFVGRAVKVEQRKMERATRSILLTLCV